MVYTLSASGKHMVKRTERKQIALDHRVYARLNEWKNKLFPDQKFVIEGKTFESRRTSWNEFFLAVITDAESGYFACPQHRKHRIKCEYCRADYYADEETKNTEKVLMAEKLGHQHGLGKEW
jgi:hypothetical protein